MPLADLHARIKSFGGIGDRLCQSLTDYLLQLGMARDRVPRITVSDLAYSTQRDPYSGEISLHGEWRDAGGMLCGSLDYRGDGTFYLEHDVLQPHPTDRRWIIEAITAWGTVENLKLEPRLMAALAE
ncbi:MAG: hypothetical protein AB1810_07500 [Pseudomonadota bacterium]